MKKLLVAGTVAMFSFGAFAQSTYINIMDTNIFTSKDRSVSNLFEISKNDLVKNQNVSCIFYNKATNTAAYAVEMGYLAGSYGAQATIILNMNEIVSSNIAKNLSDLSVTLEAKTWNKLERWSSKSIIIGSQDKIKEAIYNVDSREVLNFKNAIKLSPGKKDVTLKFKDTSLNASVVCE